MKEPSKQSLELSAQCWCDEETENKTMDVELAVAFAKRLDEKDTVQHAMKVLTKAMQDTELGSYAHGWHCNIAMMCYDAISSKTYDAPYGFDHELAHKIGNDAASRFMKICFDIKTTNEAPQ